MHKLAREVVVGVPGGWGGDRCCEIVWRVAPRVWVAIHIYRRVQRRISECGAPEPTQLVWPGGHKATKEPTQLSGPAGHKVIWGPEL